MANDMETKNDMKLISLQGNCCLSSTLGAIFVHFLGINTYFAFQKAPPSEFYWSV